MTTREGSAYGSGRTRMPCATATDVVLTPIPSARVAIDRTAKPGRLRMPRRAYRVSRQMPAASRFVRSIAPNFITGARARVGIQFSF